MLEKEERMSDTALVTMARYPEKGQTKTRLARAIGDEPTLRLYQAFLTDIAQRFAGWTYDLYWAYTPADAGFAAFAATLAPEHAAAMHSFPQQGADFGARLHQVFLTTSALHFQYTIVIGSDSPQISRTMIAQARQTLAYTDVVLGPAEDGGYYLIAMKEPYDLFSGIPMSTDVVLQMTLAKAQSQGLSVHLLEPLFDVDEQAELLRLAALLQTDRSLAPYTAACLASLEEVLS